MQIIKLDATESTNTYLKELTASGSYGDFTVVVAKNQWNGRGQMGNHWLSEEGKNLTFSVLIKNSDFYSQSPFGINMAVALAIVECLQGFQIPHLKIKWPNDILSGNSKICGILIENILSGNAIRASIIGIGLNVNQTLFPNIPNASSLKCLLGRNLDLEELLDALLNRLKRIFKEADENGIERIQQAYHNDLFRKDKPSTFQKPDGKRFMGFIRGISSDGKLVITGEDHINREFGFKEVQLLY